VEVMSIADVVAEDRKMRMTEKEQRQLTRVARFYYLLDLNQREIARRLNVSVPTVSRYLSRAKREKIVEISIRKHREDMSELEIEIENRFQIRECMVVANGETEDETYTGMAELLADLLSRLLTPDSHVGLSWGETLKNVGERIQAPLRAEAQFVPIIGAMGMIETGIYPNSIARTFADRLGGISYLVNSPAILDSRETRESLETESNFLQVRALWAQLDTAIMSVSGLDDSASVARLGIFSPAERASLRERGVVCATNFHMLDARGNPVQNDISDRILNLDLETLRSLRNVIIIARGMHKVRAIRAALAGRIAHVLITDRETAERLLADT